MSNLASILAISASQYPDRPAIRNGDVVLSYRDLNRSAGQVAAYLQAQGVAPGDRVAIMLPNVPAFAELFFGVLRVGAVAVPMNPLLKAGEVEYYLSDSGAKLIFGWTGMIDQINAGALAAGAVAVEIDAQGVAPIVDGEEPVTVDAPRVGSDSAVLLYTSGTTGRPKGADLTHDAMNSNREVTARTLISLVSDDIVMGCLPLFHVFGLTVGLNATIGAGACLTLMPRFEAVAALEMLRDQQVTVFLGVPTMYAGVLAAGRDNDTELPALRVCASGGSAMPVAVLHAFEERFGTIVLEGYGLSETSPVASFNHPDRPRKAGSIGTPIEGVQMRLWALDGTGQAAPGDSGEIQVRGRNVMRGYWNQPEATAQAIDADGWFSTGDIGTVDDEGYYTIVDRKKDLIIRGGYNVYPREVEEALYEHPQVAEAAVIGIPHDELGEEIGAAVALKPGSEVTAQELSAFVKDRLAAYKYPRQVWFVDELPKNATGKILRREVRFEPESAH